MAAGLTQAGPAGARRLVLVLLAVALAARASGSRELLIDTGDGSDGDLALIPIQMVMYDHDVFYQIPDNPIGTVGLFHGCCHGGGDFWVPTTDCPATICRGGLATCPCVCAPACLPPSPPACLATTCACTAGWWAWCCAETRRCFCGCCCVVHLRSANAAVLAPPCRSSGGDCSHQAGAGVGLCRDCGVLC